MPLETSLVDIESIEVNQDFPAPSSSQIEHLANKIATVGELLELPVVLFLEIDRYELLSSFAAYKAFIKAREINPDLSSSIRVFIAKESNKADILDQVKELNGLSTRKLSQKAAADKIAKADTVKTTSSDSDIELEISNLAASLERFSAKVINQQDEMQTTLTELVNAQPKPLPILEAFNQVDRPEIHQRLAVAIAKSSGFTSAEKKKIEKVIERVQFLKAQEPDLEFATLNDFLEKLGREKVKGRKLRYLTEKSLLKLIDQWPL